MSAITAADLAMVTTRKTATPANAPALVSALRDSVRDWDALAAGERENGGKISAAGRRAARLASLLVTEHNADTDALKTLVAGRRILEVSDADALKALRIKTEAATPAPKRS